MEVLPLILLGLRSIILENINASTSELVYGVNLRLPGHFFHSTKSTVTDDPNSFVQILKNKMNQLQPVPSSNHSKKKIFVSHRLHTCTHVFVRKDGVKKSLQQCYEGPFEVLKRNTKFFTLKIKNKDKVVSINRLKPMFQLRDLNKPPKKQKKVSFKLPYHKNK